MAADTTSLFMELDENDIKDILRNREEKLKLLDERKQLLEKELRESDPAARISSPKLDGMPGGGLPKDLADRIIRSASMQDRESNELAREIWYINLQKDSIDRVWRCLLALPDPYYGIIRNLYTTGKLYTTAQKESGYSHTTFETKRSAGMKLLLQFYRSSYSTNELIRQGRGGTEEIHFSVRARHGRKRGGMPEGQMTLADLDKEIKAAQ